MHLTLIKNEILDIFLDNKGHVMLEKDRISSSLYLNFTVNKVMLIYLNWKKSLQKIKVEVKCGVSSVKLAMFKNYWDNIIKPKRTF